MPSENASDETPAPSGSDTQSLYVILNVARTATADDIRAAYRRLSRRFHPDKHVDPAAKASANEAFTKIKEAHEILSSKKLRQIYDEFGIEAARTAQSPGMEMTPYEDLAARFREEFAAHAKGPYGGGGMGSPRDSYFNVTNSLEPKIDATGLVAALDDGYDWTSLRTGANVYRAPLAILTQVSLSTNATAYVSPKNTVSMQYSLMNRPRTHGPKASAMIKAFPAEPLAAPTRTGLISAGELALSGRRMLSQYASAEAAAFFPLDPRDGITLTAKWFRNLSDRMSGALDATFDTVERGLTLALSSSRQFDLRRSANISWAAGQTPGVSFSYRREAYDEYIDTDARSSKRQNADPFGPDDDDDNDGDTRDGVDAGGAGENAATAEHSSANHSTGTVYTNARKRAATALDVVGRNLAKVERLFSSTVWDPVGGRMTLQLSPGDAGLGVVLRRPIGRNAPWFSKSEPTGAGGGHIRLRMHLGLRGWEVEAGGGRRYMAADTAWSTAVVLGTYGVLLRVKVYRSGHRFHLPIVLVSTHGDARTATIAAIATSAAVSAVQILVVKPWNDRAEAAQREEAKQARSHAMTQSRSEAEAARELMRRAVDTSKRREEAAEGGGLIVLRAVYGLRRKVVAVALEDPSFAGREIEEEVTEVGDCVQALVEDSRVQVLGSTKSNIMGFWDPTALGDDDKALRVWYRFRSAMHDCVIDDLAPLELPLSTHKVA